MFSFKINKGASSLLVTGPQGKDRFQDSELLKYTLFKILFRECVL